MIVVPYAVEDNDVSFLTLESIHSVYVILKIGHEIYQKLHLSLIRRNNADAQRSWRIFIEFLNKLQSFLSLPFIQKGFIIVALRAFRHIYKVDPIWKLFHIDWTLSVLNWDVIFEQPFIELLGRKLADLWMHPVLLIEHNLLSIAVQKPFKQTSWKFCLAMIIGHDRWR